MLYLYGDDVQQKHSLSIKFAVPLTFPPIVSTQHFVANKVSHGGEPGKELLGLAASTEERSKAYLGLA